jgi:hypothetical protein
VRAAATASELRAVDRDDLYALLAQPRVRVHVALVGDHDARLEADDVVAVVPLLARHLRGVAAGRDDAHTVDAERVLERLDDVAVERLDDRERVRSIAGPQRPDLHALVDHRGVQRHGVAVDHRHDRVEVHVGARRRQLHGEHEPRGIMGEQVAREDPDRLG